MQKSYVVKSTISFIDFNFYVRPGDLLVHDTANHNRLTVYRNGQIVKVIRVEPIGIAAFLKSKFIEEPPANAPTVLVAVVAVKEAPKATPVVTDAPVSLPEQQKPTFIKKDKPKEVTVEKVHEPELQETEK